MSSSPSTEGEVAPPAHGAASDQRPAGRGGDGPTASWVEVVATVVLALAAVATAWSGYQASRWHGEQAIAFSRANASRLESTRASNLAKSGSARSCSRPWPPGSPPARSNRQAPR